MPDLKRSTQAEGNKKHSNVPSLMLRPEQMPTSPIPNLRHLANLKTLRKHGTALAHIFPFQPHRRVLPRETLLSPVKMVILANQALRATVKAMWDLLAT